MQRSLAQKQDNLIIDSPSKAKNPLQFQHKAEQIIPASYWGAFYGLQTLTTNLQRHVMQSSQSMVHSQWDVG